MTRKDSKKTLEIDDFSSDYDVEEIGFDNLIVGSPVATFSFSDNTEEASNGTSSSSIDLTCPSNSSNYAHSATERIKKETAYNTINTSSEILDNRKAKAAPNGITPPIDGEHFDIKRGYTFRKSTLRKLNELKAAHPDVNVYLSTIIDEAINHYFNYVFLENNKR
ncbi:hypothetical protein J2Z44_002799 [Clostridium punense]|uniref:Uncharacterized protein n=1 Tax=Clostridium punense TaxID=1054297 RepID=A0ABS4K5B9_9CLOT|nr:MULTISPECIES: hypothetical protein [Clostridium]EQB89546.1 hypothetical protein M918_20140 [Clostridium sp. BL8]MBP2022974.1 hypothetical protein [Clostridium punense]